MNTDRMIILKDRDYTDRRNLDKGLKDSIRRLDKDLRDYYKERRQVALKEAQNENTKTWTHHYSDTIISAGACF